MDGDSKVQEIVLICKEREVILNRREKRKRRPAWLVLCLGGFDSLSFDFLALTESFLLTVSLALELSQGHPPGPALPYGQHLGCLHETPRKKTHLPVCKKISAKIPVGPPHLVDSSWM